MENPVISAGSTSGVNCTLFCIRVMLLAKATAIVVFPTPGISSIKICPPAKIAARIFFTHSSFPITAFFTSSIIFRATSTYCAIFRPPSYNCETLSLSYHVSSMYSIVVHKKPSAYYTLGIFYLIIFLITVDQQKQALYQPRCFHILLQC